MATLKDPTQSTLALRARHWVGRSARADLQLTDPVVSEEHAVIAWTNDGWVVRDLGSLNGTFASGNRIAPGVGVSLQVGDTLAFGTNRPTYTLIDDQPPVAVARTPHGEVQGDYNGVRVPLGPDRVAVVTRQAQDEWMLRHADRVVTVRDGQSVAIDGLDVVLMLPEVLRPTQPVQGQGVPGLGLVFRVSADEEYVEITVDFRGKSVGLPARAHHYPLMVLARARVADACTPDADREAGWVYTADLQRMLQLSASHINLVVHRARRELEALGVHGAERLIERRLTTRQMRLGVANVRVERL